MKITQQAEYASVIAEELAKNYGNRLVALSEIAESRHLSYPFLRKVAYLLRESRLIIGEEGKGGGYRLSKQPSELKLSEILAAVGQPLSDEECWCRSPHAECSKRSICPQLSVLRKIAQAVEQTYGSLTLDVIAKGEISCANLWRR